MKNNQRRVKKQTKYNSIKNGFNRTVEQEQELSAYYNSLLCKA